nr:late embryogenesis abundant protein LEA15 [Pinus tabuliformis]
MASPKPIYGDIVDKILGRNTRRKRMIRNLCSTILSLLIVVGVSVFITWLVLRPHEPKYYVEYASYPELSVTDRILNSRMELNLTTRNPSSRIGIYYYKMEGYIYYGDQRIAGSHIGPFYQGHKGVRVLQPTLTAHSVILREDIARDLMLENSAGTLELRLKLYAHVRFKVRRSKSRHYNMRVKCDQLKVDRNTGGNSFNHRRCSVHL